MENSEVGLQTAMFITELEVFVEDTEDKGSLSAPYIPMSEFKKVIKEYSGVFMTDEIDTNGWEVGFLQPFTVFGICFQLTGSWYYGSHSVTKV